MASWPPSKAGYGSAISDLRLEWDVHGGYVVLDVSLCKTCTFLGRFLGCKVVFKCYKSLFFVKMVG